MKRTIRNCYIGAGALLALFILLTATVLTVDVQPIGPEQSKIGLAAINGFVFRALGVNLLWYQVTNWVSAVAFLVALGFTALGLVQLIKRKSIRRVDKDILALGAVYLSAVVLYALFEVFVVNYRPVILSGGLEASYPSSHTMIVMSVMATAVIKLRTLLPGNAVRVGAGVASALVIAVVAVGRLLSGVHWLTDIVGGLLLGAALSLLYYAVTRHIGHREK